MNRRCFHLATFLVFFLSLSVWAQEKGPGSGVENRLFELRTYHTEPGRLDALLARFRNHTVALFTKHGMNNIGYWIPEEGDGQTLVYLLAYPDKSSRETAWKNFLNDPDWKAAKEDSEKDGKIVAKVDSLFLTPTDFSPVVKASQGDTIRQFELRTYTTHEDKLPGLLARFRDHTLALFEKHGMTNVFYATPESGQAGSEVTLVYLLAHKDDAARKASFAAFSKDPDWIAARDASEKDGPLLIKGGVKSIRLNPTDFSPLH